MSAKAAKSSVKQRKIRPFSVFMLMIMFGVSVIAAILALIPKRYDVSIGAPAPETIIAPYEIEDEARTQELQALLGEDIAPVYIQKGQVIARAGEAITEAQYDLLARMDVLKDDARDIWLCVGIVLFMLLVYAVFGTYLGLFRKEEFANTKKMTIITVFVSVTLLLSLASSLLYAMVTPLLIAVILTTLLVGKKSAMAVNIVTSLCVALITGKQGSAVLSATSFASLAAMLAAGQAAICFISLNSRRSAIIGGGAAAAAAGALTIAAIYMVRLEPLITVLVDAAWVFGSHVIATVLCVGTLSVWESLFDIATDARLHELCNTNNPLLKQLVAEAPGTYQHSVAVASLAENAAQAIGANGLLSRVCGYYHDVGKLRRPLYFKENQKPNENIHDTLNPQESAAIITAHTKDGVALLNKYKFPSAVTKIVSEHHGNTMAAYFYYKAVQLAGGRPVPQKAYRYPGMRPSSKESAILMLADSCEAAVRSISSPSWEAIEEMVHKVIRTKVDDGQLALCPLTMLEMTQIESSFLRTLNGLMHERIEYPQSRNINGGM